MNNYESITLLQYKVQALSLKLKHSVVIKVYPFVDSEVCNTFNKYQALFYPFVDSEVCNTFNKYQTLFYPFVHSDVCTTLDYYPSWLFWPQQSLQLYIQQLSRFSLLTTVTSAIHSTIYSFDHSHVCNAFNNYRGTVYRNSLLLSTINQGIFFCHTQPYDDVNKSFIHWCHHDLYTMKSTRTLQRCQEEPCD